jgi:hypothetical protein
MKASSLQMAKVSAALARYDQAGGLFISVLTNPTMGGVAASFASLGDLIFAEPKALIGFAGPRTIKATIRLELPKGFQTSEFLLDHGFIDRIVPRSRLKSEIAKAIDYCGKYAARQFSRRGARLASSCAGCLWFDAALKPPCYVFHPQTTWSSYTAGQSAPPRHFNLATLASRPALYPRLNSVPVAANKSVGTDIYSRGRGTASVTS